MIPKNRIPPHPGEMLLEEFLRPMEITQVALSERTGMSLPRINELVNGKRGITPETAWALSQAFGTSPEMWMNMQSQYDLATKRPEKTVKAFAK